MTKFPDSGEPIGKILSMRFICNNIFAFCTKNPSGVFTYNTSGNLVHKIGTKGRGPGEYLSPTIIDVYNDTLYIWCSQQLKLIMFNKDSEYIGELNNLDAKSIADFKVHCEWICFYHTGGWNETISIYNRHSYAYAFKGCPSSNEHKVLATNPKIGGLVVKDSSLYFAYADQLTLYKLNLINFNLIEKLTINDPAFKVTSLMEDAHVFISSNRTKLVDYIMNNSVVTGLYLYGDTIMITAQTGNYKKVSFSQRIDLSQRKYKYYFITNDKYIESVSLNIDTLNMEYQPIYDSFNDKLFSVTGHIDNNEFYYKLSHIQVMSPSNNIKTPL